MKPLWDDVGEETLKHLYYEKNLNYSAIANMYGINKNRVRYKRRKFNISYKIKMYKGILPSQDGQLNTYYKNNLLKRDNIPTYIKSYNTFCI